MALTRSIRFLKHHLSLGSFRDSFKEHVKMHLWFVCIRPVGNQNRFCNAISGAGLGFLEPRSAILTFSANTKYTNIPVTAVCVRMKCSPSLWSAVPARSSALPLLPGASQTTHVSVFFSLSHCPPFFFLHCLHWHLSFCTFCCVTGSSCSGAAGRRTSCATYQGEKTADNKIYSDHNLHFWRGKSDQKISLLGCI